jgi:hypothetical protein
VARHVDFAATAKETDKPKADVQIDLSAHALSHSAKRLRARPSEARESLTALDQNRLA